MGVYYILLYILPILHTAYRTVLMIMVKGRSQGKFAVSQHNKSMSN